MSWHHDVKISCTTWHFLSVFAHEQTGLSLRRYPEKSLHTFVSSFIHYCSLILLLLFTERMGCSKPVSETSTLPGSPPPTFHGILAKTVEMTLAYAPETILDHLLFLYCYKLNESIHYLRDVWFTLFLSF